MRATLLGRLCWGMHICQVQGNRRNHLDARVPLSSALQSSFRPSPNSASIIPRPLPERGVKSIFIAAIWHTKVVMRVTTLSDKRPPDDLAKPDPLRAKRGKAIQMLRFGATGSDGDHCMTSSSDYFLDCAIPRYNECVCRSDPRGGQAHVIIGVPKETYPGERRVALVPMVIQF